MSRDDEKALDCEFFQPRSGGQVLARCLIPVQPEKVILPRFCQDCQVRAIRQGAHCSRLRFGSAVHIGVLSQTQEKARLYCARRDNRRIRLSRCARCPDYEKAQKNNPTKADDPSRRHF